MKQTTLFTLKCVGCKKTEQRPAEQCKEQPFCECGMPMVLSTVAITHTGRGILRALEEELSK